MKKQNEDLHRLVYPKEGQDPKLRNEGAMINKNKEVKK